MRKSLIVVTVFAALFGVANVASADITGFIGSTVTPSNRMVRGGAIGISLVVVGFEFEYADTSDDAAAQAPSLKTGMGNFFVQTPIPVAGVQFYATVGAGLYREELGTARTTNVGSNLGGGIKMTLAGPLRLRVDYRVFTLHGSPLSPHPQRVYAGLNLAF